MIIGYKFFNTIQTPYALFIKSTHSDHLYRRLHLWDNWWRRRWITRKLFLRQLPSLIENEIGLENLVVTQICSWNDGWERWRETVVGDDVVVVMKDLKKIVVGTVWWGGCDSGVTVEVRMAWWWWREDQSTAVRRWLIDSATREKREKREVGGGGLREKRRRWERRKKWTNWNLQNYPFLMLKYQITHDVCIVLKNLCVQLSFFFILIGMCIVNVLSNKVYN